MSIDKINYNADILQDFTPDTMIRLKEILDELRLATVDLITERKALETRVQALEDA